MRVRIPCIHLVWIVSKRIVNKGNSDRDLLVKYPLALPKKPLQPQTSKPKPRVWSCKNALEKRTIAKLVKSGKLNKELIQIKLLLMKTLMITILWKQQFIYYKADKNLTSS